MHVCLGMDSSLRWCHDVWQQMSENSIECGCVAESYGNQASLCASSMYTSISVAGKE